MAGMAPGACGGHDPPRQSRGVLGDPAALGRETWIALDSVILRRNLATLGINAADYVVVDSLETQKGLIEAGFGIGVLLAASVAPELRAGRFHVLRSRWSRGVLPIVSVLRHDELGRGAPERFLTRLTGLRS